MGGHAVRLPGRDDLAGRQRWLVCRDHQTCLAELKKTANGGLLLNHVTIDYSIGEWPHDGTDPVQ